jgi:predicted  nucleic acid-binding Zn-ribbon protein
MSVIDAIAEAGAKPAGKRPYFLDVETETVLAITMAAVQELAVSRQRIDTLERLLEQKGVLTRAEIEAYRPDPQAAIERALSSQEYIARVLRIIQQRNEANRAEGDIASEEVAEEIGAGA